jgi:hypothetical protein
MIATRLHIRRTLWVMQCLSPAFRRRTAASLVRFAPVRWDPRRDQSKRQTRKAPSPMLTCGVTHRRTATGHAGPLREGKILGTYVQCCAAAISSNPGISSAGLRHPHAAPAKRHLYRPIYFLFAVHCPSSNASTSRCHTRHERAHARSRIRRILRGCGATGLTFAECLGRPSATFDLITKNAIQDFSHLDEGSRLWMLGEPD